MLSNDGRDLLVRAWCSGTRCWLIAGVLLAGSQVAADATDSTALSYARATFEAAGGHHPVRNRFEKWRDDPYPARWIDSSGLFTPRFGEVKFEARDGNELAALVYRGSGFDPVNGPIWFVMHGASRAVERYIRAAAPVAERHDALAIAIYFSKSAYPAGRDYTLGLTTTGRPDRHAFAEGRWRQPDDYLYAEVEHVFEAVRRSLGGHQRGYYLFGHSAGAQFTHRLMTFLPEARVLAAVAANAGWYTLPAAGEDPNLAMPYGLSGTPLEQQDLRPYLAAPLVVLLGERDTTTPATDRMVRGTAEAMAQGATRLERGQFYFATAKAQAAAFGEDFNWRLAVMPRARHKASQVIGAAGFFLYVPNGTPCRPSSAAEAQGLIISEILADPPRGDRGDANADGERDPAAEEFVEIVNRGATPICLSGWALGDAKDPERHVFPLGSALAPGKALVIFGGGVPTGRFGGADVQWAAFGKRLSLTNGGDVLTLRDGADRVVKQISWGDCAGKPCAADHRPGELGIASSIVRWPEPAGTWMAHARVAGSDFSPGARADGSDW